MDEHTELTVLRRKLHRIPELSGMESRTASVIKDFILRYKPDSIIEQVGGNGLIVIYEASLPGPSILFRSELDALPIQETNQFSYRSGREGISHKCGHDGHMAILAGLARELSFNRPSKGKVILLFQPAEETGEGAGRVLNDPALGKVNPDYVFALHNVPGHTMGTVICKAGIITPSVRSIIIDLEGKTAHAAEPENGVNPAGAIAKIINTAYEMQNPEESTTDFCLITPIQIAMGEEAYGTSAGYGKLSFTIRCLGNRKMEELSERFTQRVFDIADAENLKVKHHWLQEFFSNNNDENCSDIIRDAAIVRGMKYFEPDKPFKWGEDFGLFTEKYRGALFGLGAGRDTPALHNPDYDFPDELIPIGVEIFSSIKEKILSLHIEYKSKK